MAEFINKHTIKIQLGMLAVIIVSIVAWSVKAGAYVEKFENHTQELSSHQQRIENLERMFPTLATKADIEILKKDLKDYINKK